MPRIPIPQFQAQQMASGQVRPALPASPDLSGLAQGLSQANASFQRIEDERKSYDEHIEREQKKARVVERVSNDRLKWTETLQNRMKEAPAGAAEFTPKLLKEVDTYRDEALKAIADPEERRMYGGMLVHLREDLGQRAVKFESEARRGYRQQVLTNGVDVDARVVSMDPTQFQSVLAQRLGVIDASNDLSVIDKEALSLKARDLLSLTAAQTMVDRDPSGWLKSTASPEAAKSNPILAHIPPERLAALNSHARALVEHGNQQDRYQLQTEIRDVQTMVLSGVAPPPNAIPSEERFVAAYGPTGSQRWREEVGSYLELGSALTQMQGASYEERRKLILEAKPTPGQGFAVGMRNSDSVLKANELLEKRIASDPAAYALQTSPRVKNAAAIMERVLNDPKMPAEDRVAAMNFYAETQISWQQRAGVQQINDQRRGNERTAAPLRLLTNEQANAIAARFYDQSQGGAKAAELVTGLEMQWGKHWPAVYAQLAADNKLPPSALVIPNMPNDASRSRMAAASAMKKSDLEALVDSADPKAIRESLQSQFDAAQRTFTAQGADGSRTLSTVIGEAEKLALMYRSEGKSVSQAAKQAYTETMGHRYDFGDTYRVPREQDPGAVKAGATFAHRRLAETADLKVFATGAPESITSDAIRARGMWVTDGDESGLRFVLQGSDGGFYAVHDKDGKPVSYAWEALRRMAAEAKTPEAQAQEHTEEMRRRQRELNPRR